MKVLEVIQSMIVPNHMYKRRKMNVLFSILIMVIGIYALATPISYHFSQKRYEVLETSFDFKVFQYVDEVDLVSEPVTEEERARFNMVSLEDLRNLGINVSAFGFTDEEKVEAGKEYVLKSLVPVKDNEGTITSYIPYYVHIVFETGEENKYNIEENFDKLPKENDVFNHFLLVFYKEGFIYRSNYEISNKMSPAEVFYDKKIDINFAKVEKGTDISYPVIDMMVPMYKYQYQLRASLYVVLFPCIMALLFSVILKGTGLVKGFKEYFNMAAVSSVPLLLFIMISSFINIGVCNMLFQWYPYIFIIYYFIIIVLTNRKPRVE